MVLARKPDATCAQGVDDGGRTAALGMTLVGEAQGCQAWRMRSQVVSRASGRTRVSAVTVMKLVSPIQRGRACMWMCAAMPAPLLRRG